MGPDRHVDTDHSKLARDPFGNSDPAHDHMTPATTCLICLRTGDFFAPRLITIASCQPDITTPFEKFQVCNIASHYYSSSPLE